MKHLCMAYSAHFMGSGEAWKQDMETMQWARDWQIIHYSSPFQGVCHVCHINPLQFSLSVFPYIPALASVYRCHKNIRDPLTFLLMSKILPENQSRNTIRLRPYQDNHQKQQLHYSWNSVKFSMNIQSMNWW